MGRRTRRRREEAAGGPEEERRRFVFPPRSGFFERIDLSLLDPADPDDRHVLILAEHRDLARALRQGRDEIVLHGERISPRLHITMHEVVATQLWEDDPPEVWQTARRLLAAGYGRHDVLHMLGSVVATEMWGVLHEGREYDHARYVRALDALPGSCERL